MAKKIKGEKGKGQKVAHCRFVVHLIYLVRQQYRTSYSTSINIVVCQCCACVLQATPNRWCNYRCTRGRMQKQKYVAFDSKYATNPLPGHHWAEKKRQSRGAEGLGARDPAFAKHRGISSKMPIFNLVRDESGRAVDLASTRAALVRSSPIDADEVLKADMYWYEPRSILQVAVGSFGEGGSGENPETLNPKPSKRRRRKKKPHTAADLQIRRWGRRASEPGVSGRNMALRPPNNMAGFLAPEFNIPWYEAYPVLAVLAFRSTPRAKRTAVGAQYPREKPFPV